MSVVTLVSGGLDSMVMAAMCSEEGLAQHPLFIDYGQRSARIELAACRAGLRRLKVGPLVVANLRGFARVAPSGLTNAELDVFEDAFTPGRNMLFLTAGVAHAVTMNADAVAIGLLNEDTSLFPDQTKTFLTSAEATLSIAVGRPIRVLAPLAACSKSDVIAMARRRRIHSTYSCHTGAERACGKCVACREFNFSEEV